MGIFNTLINLINLMRDGKALVPYISLLCALYNEGDGEQHYYYASP